MPQSLDNRLQLIWSEHKDHEAGGRWGVGYTNQMRLLHRAIFDGYTTGFQGALETVWDIARCRSSKESQSNLGLSSSCSKIWAKGDLEKWMEIRLFSGKVQRRQIIKGLLCHFKRHQKSRLKALKAEKFELKIMSHECTET